MHIAARNVASGLHIDRFDGHFVQIAGEKRWILFPPDHGTILHQGSWHCAVNPDKPDIAAFPSMAAARGLEAILRPGDVMYFPTGWFHKVRNLSSIGISMSFFFDPQFGEQRKIPPSLAFAEAQVSRQAAQGEQEEPRQ